MILFNNLLYLMKPTNTIYLSPLIGTDINNLLYKNMSEFSTKITH